MVAYRSVLVAAAATFLPVIVAATLTSNNLAAVNAGIDLSAGQRVATAPQSTIGKKKKLPQDAHYVDVPGYEKIAVPDAQRDELIDINHSAVGAAVEMAETEDSDEPDFSTSPADGRFIKFFKGNDITQAVQFAEENMVHFPLTFSNPAKGGMCILASFTNLQTGVGDSFAVNGTEIAEHLYIPGKTMAQVGNFLPSEGYASYNGRAQAAFDCDKTCQKCSNVGPAMAHKSLFEWAYMKDIGDSQADGYWSNLSNVDGLSSNVNATAYNNNMEVCNQSVCETNAKEVQASCPPQLFWKDGKNVGCVSQCSFSGKPEHCCVKEFVLGVCKASSTFNHEVCPQAYSWAYDDVGHVDRCDTKDLKFVFVEFSPIK